MPSVEMVAGIEAAPVQYPVRLLVSGGGGSGVCSHRHAVGVEGGTPEAGALFRFVEGALTAAGAVSGRMAQAFADTASSPISSGAAWP